MAYEKQTWEDEIPSTTPVKYEIDDSVKGMIATDATIVTKTPITPGTPMNAAHLNHMEDGIEEAHDLAEAAQAAADVAQSTANTANETANAAVPKSAFDQVGDMLYAQNYGIPVRLPKGNAHQIIRMNPAGSAPIWTSFAYACVGRAAAQSIPNGTNTNVIFDTVIEDVLSMWSAGNPTRLTLPYAGLWAIGAFVMFEGNAAGIRMVQISGFASDLSIAPSGSTYMKSPFTIRRFSANDYIQLIVLQSSGGALNIPAGGAMLWALFLGV